MSADPLYHRWLLEPITRTRRIRNSRWQQPGDALVLRQVSPPFGKYHTEGLNSSTFAGCARLNELRKRSFFAAMEPIAVVARPGRGHDDCCRNRTVGVLFRQERFHYRRSRDSASFSLREDNRSRWQSEQLPGREERLTREGSTATTAVLSPLTPDDFSQIVLVE